MADPIATTEDVLSLLPEFEGHLTAEDIQPYLDDAAFENAQANDVAEMGDDVQRYIEKKLAALFILTYPERDAASESGASFSVEYDASRVERLERDIERHDPSGDLLGDDDPEFVFEAY